MAAPDMTQKMTVFVQKTGTDDPGYNIVGAPYSRLTIAAALADLADTTRYPAASSTFFHIVAVGPGTFTEAGIALPPWTFIVGSCDGEDQPTTIILTSADINLTSAWTANATARGGFANCTVRAASGTPALDMTMPVPVAGNPTRTVEFQNFHHNLTSQIFEATSTADNFIAQLFRQFGTNTDTIRFTSGTTRVNNFWSAASVNVVDKANFAASGNWDGLVVSNAAATVTINSIAAAGNTFRLSNSSVRLLVLSQTAPGVLAVSADTTSIPLRASVSVTGTATLAANLTILSDAAGVAYSPTTPGDWAAPVPATVQQALDRLATGGGGTGTFVRIIRTGNNSLAAWGTAGAAINDTANTFTDSTSAGAVAGVTAARSFGIPTFASAGGVTYADAVNVYIAGAPVITGGVATNSWSLYIAAGNSRITSGGLYFGAATPGNISGSAGSLTFTAAGTNQNIICVPTGSGYLYTSTAPIYLNTTNLSFRGFASDLNADAYCFNLVYPQSNASTGHLSIGTQNAVGGAFAETARFVNSGHLLIGTTTDGTGVIQLATATTAAGGMTFSTDTNFFRAGPGGLVLNYAGGTSPSIQLQENGTTRAIFSSSSTAVTVGSNSTGTLSLIANNLVAVSFATTLIATFSAAILSKTGVSLALGTTDFGTGLTIDSSTAKATFAATIKTAAPTVGIAAEWKLGTYTAGAAVQGGTVRVNVAGTDRDLLCV